MEANELETRRDQLQIVDVRETHEWDAGHIDGAVHIPERQLAGRLGDIDRGRPVVTVCRSGQRSGKAAQLLDANGYRAANLSGGVMAWAEAGLPLQSATGTAGTVAAP